MEKFACMALVVVIAVSLMEGAAAQTVHVVGDSMGWTIPTGGAGAYDTWAATKSFVVGDILTFNFVTNEHDVLQVPKASYDGCTSSNPIGTTITTGPANITLNSAGQHYYICTFGRHCQAGQKLAITVSTTPGTSPSPVGNPAPPTTPTTPSPDSGSPTDCTPAPKSGPTAGGPTRSAAPTNNPTGNPDSSSSFVFASALVSMLAIVMHGLFF